MAESVVSFAVERLGDLLIQEAVFLHGIREQVERLKVELWRMKCFLRDADAKQDENERVRNWVAEIRDVAYDAEDVIDTFIFKVASIRRMSVFKRCAFFFVKSKELHRVGVEIQTIQARISDISTSRETYGIQNLGEREGLNERWRQLRRSYPHFEDENIIGLEDHTKMLVAELIKEKEQPRVIAVVGMGGSGKTTLAKKIYNHNDTKRHFDCCAWTFISQQCMTEEVLREILRQTGSSVGDGDKDLMVMLHNRLKEKRYLVVLDDIWSTEAWDLLKPAFPKGKTGSKIILTTRIKEVALHVDANCLLHEPRRFTDEESWDLIRKKAFSHQESIALLGASSTSYVSSLPFDIENFKKLGKEMAHKCGNLPLAITALGGVLATKKSLDEWKSVQKNLSFYLSKYKVHGILALSYNELPVELKPCFLYLGLYPEDFEIPRKILIKLWIAEGFIAATEANEEEKMEDIADRYLAELIGRGMVQVDEMDDSVGIVKTCRLHDLIRDLCIIKAREERFMEVSAPTTSSVEVSSTKNSKVAAHGSPTIVSDLMDFLDLVTIHFFHAIHMSVNIAV